MVYLFLLVVFPSNQAEFHIKETAIFRPIGPGEVALTKDRIYLLNIAENGATFAEGLAIVKDENLHQGMLAELEKIS